MASVSGESGVRAGSRLAHCRRQILETVAGTDQLCRKNATDAESTPWMQPPSHRKDAWVMKQSIGDFLLRRLEEAGIRHIFGVPGDYNLELLQQLENRGTPAW